MAHSVLVHVSHRSRMMIAILVSSFIHSSKTVLAVLAEDGRVCSSHVPFVVYTTSGNSE